MALQLSSITDRSGTDRDAVHVPLVSFAPARSADGKTVTVSRITLKAYASKAAMDDGYDKIDIDQTQRRHEQLKRSPGLWLCQHCEEEATGYECPEECPSCGKRWETDGEDGDYEQFKAPRDELSAATLKALDTLWPLIEADLKAAKDDLAEATIVADAKMAEAQQIPK